MPTSPPSTAADATTIELVVARLSPIPPARPSMPLAGSRSATRLPRPDDPTPRKPPLRYFGSQRSSSPLSDVSSGVDASSSVSALAPPPAAKRRKITSIAEDEVSKAQDGALLRHAQSVMRGGALGGGARVLARAKTVAAVEFKVPAMPSMPKVSARTKQRPLGGGDIFGGSEGSQVAASVERAASVLSVDGLEDEGGSIESENKAASSQFNHC
jgi:hypothetical protein